MSETEQKLCCHYCRREPRNNVDILLWRVPLGPAYDGKGRCKPDDFVCPGCWRELKKKEATEGDV